MCRYKYTLLNCLKIILSMFAPLILQALLCFINIVCDRYNYIPNIFQTGLYFWVQICHFYSKKILNGTPIPPRGRWWTILDFNQLKLYLLHFVHTFTTMDQRTQESSSIATTAGLLRLRVYIGLGIWLIFAYWKK